MSRVSAHQRGAIVFDELAHRLRQMVRDVHTRELSGVERFRVVSVSPFTVQQVQGELSLEDGDPDFTVGEGLRTQLGAGVVQAGHLVWVGRSDQEWHAFDTVGAGAGFPTTNATALQGRAVSSTAPVGGQALAWDATSNSWKPTSPPAPAWNAMTLINSWVRAFGAGAADEGYLKDSSGVVRNRGRVLGGANGSIAYQLPVGFRPGNIADTYPLTAFNSVTPIAGGASIDGSGNVRLYYAAGATDIGLSGITFLAEN